MVSVGSEFKSDLCDFSCLTEEYYVEGTVALVDYHCCHADLSTKMADTAECPAYFPLLETKL